MQFLVSPTAQHNPLTQPKDRPGPNCHTVDFGICLVPSMATLDFCIVWETKNRANWMIAVACEEGLIMEILAYIILSWTHSTGILD